jgi:hypothetical protein
MILPEEQEVSDQQVDSAQLQRNKRPKSSQSQRSQARTRRSRLALYQKPCIEQNSIPRNTLHAKIYLNHLQSKYAKSLIGLYRIPHDHEDLHLNPSLH